MSEFNTTTLKALKDLPLAPRFEGDALKVAVLWGNPETGPVSIMLHMPNGHIEPFHKHTSTYHCVIIEGEFQIQNQNGDLSEVVGPGSFISQPGGVSHAERSVGSSDLLALVYFDGPIDVIHEN